MLHEFLLPPEHRLVGHMCAPDVIKTAQGKMDYSSGDSSIIDRTEMIASTPDHGLIAFHGSRPRPWPRRTTRQTETDLTRTTHQADEPLH